MLGVWCGAGGGHLAGEPEKTSQGSFPVRGGGEGVRGQSWDGRTLGADALENKTLGARQANSTSREPPESKEVLQAASQQDHLWYSLLGASPGASHW